ncbi:MAG: class I SAM-dependent RNA methyltransferase [Acidobacteriota bacterium]
MDEVELRIDQLVTGGEGLGRFEGIPIFVPLSAPGDRLKVRLTERKPGYGRAEIVEVLQPGSGRRDPRCRHFARCGGCDLQHLDEATQLRWKAEAVRETLRRIGGVDIPERFEVVAGSPWGYRMRAQLRVGDTDEGRRGGYHARGSHDLVPVEECPVLVPELEKQLRSLPRKLRGEATTRIDLTAGDGGAVTCSPPVARLPQGEVCAVVGSFSYSYDSRCFFQGHRQLTPELVRRAVGPWGDEDGDAFDLYAGVGLFALPLARRYGRVTAVEGDRVAVRYLRRNLRENQVGAEVASQSVETWAQNLPKGPSRVIVDPPRMGLSRAVRQALVRSRPRRLTYVSCNPATLARDLQILLRHFELDSLALLDMFPQTGHMESVAQLVPRAED